jgi:hypothetical protein
VAGIHRQEFHFRLEMDRFQVGLLWYGSEEDSIIHLLLDRTYYFHAKNKIVGASSTYDF